MVKYEDECLHCDTVCIGDGCPNRRVPHCYCDKCEKKKSCMNLTAGSCVKIVLLAYWTKWRLIENGKQSDIAYK